MSVAACIVLGGLYVLAMAAAFVAPYAQEEQNLKKSFHPPTKLLWRNGLLQCQVYENVHPKSAQYRAIPGKTVPIQWFAKVKPYKLLGLIPLQSKLFQVKSSDPNDRIYLLGSDAVGRDVFSRLLYGSQISLTIGLVGVAINLCIGFILGALSGYFGGKFDFILMRMVEFLMAIPGLYLLLAIRSALASHFDSGQMYFMIVVILSFIGWPGTARIIRGMAASIRTRPFVLAAESMGQSTTKILFRHILPNLSSYLLVATTLSIPAYILGEAALSFLGLGIQEPTASWGLMLQYTQKDMKVFMLNFWWLLTPGLCILMTVMAFNIIGNRLRDIVDPKINTES